MLGRSSSPIPPRQQPEKPSAVLVDVDGTLALAQGRDHYDESTVSDDLPNPAIITIVEALHRDGHRIIVLSGRTEAARADTLAWLQQHLQVPLTGLYLRAVGDRRRDVSVKHEIYRDHIQDRYEVLCVLEDRTQVVKLWRSLGLTCLQVAPGDF
ncbi:polynucleotide kinase [Kocuria arenosa]|uniref:phosphatase domain-containing protein n=1 Tax=Kocuria arenosa TaxID=3071446 RepID=UPI0034D414FE